MWVLCNGVKSRKMIRYSDSWREYYCLKRYKAVLKSIEVFSKQKQSLNYQTSSSKSNNFLRTNNNDLLETIKSQRAKTRASIIVGPNAHLHFQFLRYESPHCLSYIFSFKICFFFYIDLFTCMWVECICVCAWVP